MRLEQAQIESPSRTNQGVGSTGTMHDDLARAARDMSRKSEIAQMFSRQAELVPADVMNVKVLIVGCGSIGSNAAHILASNGVRNFSLVDFDTVGMENVGPSWFDLHDIDTSKAQALANRLQGHFDIEDVAVFDRHQGEEQGQFDIVLSCTDAIGVRQRLWDNNNLDWNLWLDGRMGGWNAEFYAIRNDDDEGKEMYNSSFGEITTPLPCGQKATAGITKGFFPLVISSALKAYLEGEEISRLTLYNGAMPFADRLIYAN